MIYVVSKLPGGFDALLGAHISPTSAQTNLAERNGSLFAYAATLKHEFDVADTR